MAKEKLGFLRKVKYWFISHPWLKAIALILAVITWLYVRGEINKFNY